MMHTSVNYDDTRIVSSLFNKISTLYFPRNDFDVAAHALTIIYNLCFFRAHLSKLCIVYLFIIVNLLYILLVLIVKYTLFGTQTHPLCNMSKQQNKNEKKNKSVLKHSNSTSTSNYDPHKTHLCTKLINTYGNSSNERINDD